MSEHVPSDADRKRRDEIIARQAEREGQVLVRDPEKEKGKLREQKWRRNRLHGQKPPAGPTDIPRKRLTALLPVKAKAPNAAKRNRRAKPEAQSDMLQVNRQLQAQLDDVKKLKAELEHQLQKRSGELVTLQQKLSSEQQHANAQIAILEERLKLAAPHPVSTQHQAKVVPPGMTPFMRIAELEQALGVADRERNAMRAQLQPLFDKEAALNGENARLRADVERLRTENNRLSAENKRLRE